MNAESMQEHSTFGLAFLGMMQATRPVDGNVIVTLDQFLCTMDGRPSIDLTELEYTIKDWGVLDHIVVLHLLFSHCLRLGTLEKLDVIPCVELLQLCSCSSVWFLRTACTAYVVCSSGKPEHGNKGCVAYT